MSNNDYLSIRINSKLKNDFYDFCEKSGISVSAAVNTLAVKCLEKGSLPFVVSVVKYDMKKNSDNDNDVMRISIRMKKERRDSFAEVCNNTGMPMATVVKIFMMQCIDKGRFPFE